MRNRKYDVDSINLSISDWYPFVNEQFDGITIQWESDIGFGEYTIFRSHGVKEWMFDSEGMDWPDDKRFGEKLLSLILAGACDSEVQR